MDLDQVRKMMHRLNHGDPDSGVGKAKTVKAYETKEIEDVDGMLIGMERVHQGTHALGHVGSAQPCCDAPGEEHTPQCPVRSVGDDNDDAATD